MSLDQFEDENDRQHCRLDMDQVDETPDVVRDAARREWWRKWGKKVRGALLTMDEDSDQLRVDLDEAEAALKKSEAKVAELHALISRAISAHDKTLTILEEAE